LDNIKERWFGCGKLPQFVKAVILKIALNSNSLLKKRVGLIGVPVFIRITWHDLE